MYIIFHGLHFEYNTKQMCNANEPLVDDTIIFHAS